MSLGIRALSAPEHAELVAKVATAVAEATLAIAAANGFDRQAAGALATRAGLELLLVDASPSTVGAWLQRQGATVSALGPTGGHA